MCEKESCVNEKHCYQKSAFLEPMLFLNRGGFRGGDRPPKNLRKELLFTMVLYNSENNRERDRVYWHKH